MRSQPSRAIELIVGWLIPPGSREHVLGDLHEIYLSPMQYLADVAAALPLVIWSNIRRTVDPVVLLMEGFTFYVCLVLAASGMGPRTFLADDSSFIKLAIPTAAALLALILADAYSNPRKKSPLKPILGSVLAVAFAFVSQAVLSGIPGIVLPGTVMVGGCSAALLLVSTLRLLFPPPADRPRGANGPAFWQKTELAPMRLLPKTPLEYVVWAVLAGVVLLLAFHG